MVDKRKAIKPCATRQEARKMDTLSIRLTPRLKHGQIIIEVQEGEDEPYEVPFKTLRRKAERTQGREPSERVLGALRQLGEGEPGHWVTRSHLNGRVQTFKSRELTDVLGALIDAGLVESKEVITQSDKRDREYRRTMYRTT